MPLNFDFCITDRNGRAEIEIYHRDKIINTQDFFTVTALFYLPEDDLAREARAGYRILPQNRNRIPEDSNHIAYEK